MIAKWLEMLAGFIVDKAAAKFGIHDADDLEAFLAKVLRAEFPELSKLDTLPGQLVSAVGGLPAQIGGQVLAGLKTLIPGLPNIFGR